MRKSLLMSILQSLGIFRRTAVGYTMPIETIVDVIRRERINVIYGQKSFIRLIADHYMQYGIVVPKLEILIPGAERIEHYDSAGLTKGNILVTSFIKEAQPILELELGDRVAVRNHSQLSKLGATITKGRSNYLRLPDGQKISGATFYAALEHFHLCDSSRLCRAM